MYFGQDVHNIMKHKDLAPSTDPTQLHHKVDLSRSLPNVQGNCWWPAYAITANVGGVADSLARDIQATPALPPTYPWICSDTPVAPANLRRATSGRPCAIKWDVPQARGTVMDATHFVVYRFPKGSKGTPIDDPKYIVDVVYSDTYMADKPGIYVVTAVNRTNNESSPSQPLTIE